MTEKEFTYIYNKYYGRLLNTAWEVVGSREQAEDIVHDVFTKMWESFKPMEEQKTKGFLYISLMNACRNHKNKKGVDELREEIFEGAVVASEVCEDILNLIDLLPKETKEVMGLMYQKDMKLKEVVEFTGKGLNTIKNHRAYGLHVIRKNLERRGITKEYFLNQ